MKFDSHAHGMHAELDSVTKKRVPPVVPSWKESDGPVQPHIEEHRRRGIEGILLLDPYEVTFPLKKLFGDFVYHCPSVRMHESSREEILEIMSRGANGIKFIAPMQPYGDEEYFPLYEAVRDAGGLAVFHTGYQNRNSFDPGGFLARPRYLRITDCRPAELDRISRAFPDLKILMAHMGNPWWEEAFTVISKSPNVYADFSGGSAAAVDMDYWKRLFKPNGKLALKALTKMCYGSDAGMCDKGLFEDQWMMDFYEAFYDVLDLPQDLRELIDRGNIRSLLGIDG